MKALLILAEGFEEIEAISSIDLLRRAEIEVCVAGLVEKNVRSARGLVVLADFLLSEVGNQFDALILPGGAIGAKNLALSIDVKKIILKMNQENKWICAICASPAWVLAPTGILNNKCATCYPGSEVRFHSSTQYVLEKVIVHENIITSAGPGTAIDFALMIIEKLKGSVVAQKIKKDILS